MINKKCNKESKDNTKMNNNDSKDVKDVKSDKDILPQHENHNTEILD